MAHRGPGCDAGPVRMRHALARDLPTVVDVWVDAFADDPYLRWIQPDDAGWPAFGRSWMTFISDLTFQRGHTYLADGEDVAVAWIPPDLALAGPEDISRGAAIIAEHAGDEAAEAALATILEARGHSIEAPHWTLQYIGVRASSRGRGLGSTAVKPLLSTCDTERLPCGLVSTNPRNVAFYERLGFAVAGEVWTPGRSTALRPMHRPAPR